ncbi:hypothetical protein FRC01_008420, partial [Tulasnella sp. 417]
MATREDKEGSQCWPNFETVSQDLSLTMNTALDTRNQAFFEVPVPHEHFGQDGGKFYHYYDALADEIDDNMVTGLKEQLDGLLIFAGLFAGVNTAFLALTLPLMSPDPADDTNAILRDTNAILLNLARGRNGTPSNTNTLPSETFSPTGKVLTINVLFSISLTLALISSFLAVMGRQWLVYYRKRSGGGPERQRWEQLRRFLGAERWQLELVLDDFLPSLLQIGLVIFCISLVIYLNTLHPTLSKVVGAFMYAGLAILIMTAILASWDNFCPFQSPLSKAVSSFISLVSLAGRIAWSSVIYPYLLILYAPKLVDCIRQPSDEAVRSDFIFRWQRAERWMYERYLELISPLVGYFKRRNEEDGTLQLAAIRRTICTSDDARAQMHAASNLLSITDTDLLNRLATDYEFVFRILELSRSSYQRTLQLCGRDRADLATAACWLYRAA